MPLWTPPQHQQHQHQRPTSSVLLQFPQWNYFFEKKGHKKSVAVWIVALGRCYFRHLLSPFIPFFPTICWRDSQTPRNPSESMRARPQCPLNALISNLRMFNGLECGIKKKEKTQCPWRDGNFSRASMWNDVALEFVSLKCQTVQTATTKLIGKKVEGRKRNIVEGHWLARGTLFERLWESMVIESEIEESDLEICWW